MIVYLCNSWLSLWESWHAEGVTERGTMTLSDPAFAGPPLPKGEARTLLTQINDHLYDNLWYD